MENRELLSKLKKAKYDLMLLAIVLVLIFSSQILTPRLFHYSGTIMVTDGAAIPQESNYTLSTKLSASVTNAVVFNYTLAFSEVYFNVITADVSRFRFEFTLQSTQNNTNVNISVKLAYFPSSYNEQIDVVAGTMPITSSLEIDMTSVHFDPESWVHPCAVTFATDTPLEFKNVLVWAEFNTPVSPVFLNWQSTDGEPLYANPYLLRSVVAPQLEIKCQNDSSFTSFDSLLLNRTLYLRPQNYSMRATWGDGKPSVPEFNLTIVENYSTICTLRMKAVKLSFSIYQKIPLIYFEIQELDFPQHTYYRLYIEDSGIPKFLLIPPCYDGIHMIFYSIDPLSNNPYYPFDNDIFALVDIEANGTYHQNVEIQMPYWYFFGFIVTQRDFVQLLLTATLFSLVVIRVHIYFRRKKPRGSWRNSGFIPVILLSLTAFIPWFYSIRKTVLVFDETINVAAFGPFPLITSQTDSGLTFLDMPHTYVYWATLSLIVFWFPLIYFVYSMTPPRSHMEESLLFLFLPFSFTYLVQIALGELYTFSFDQNLFIVSVLLLVPVITGFCFLVSKQRS